MLCTGNQCRSPMAEVLARQHLAAVGVDADVQSAGLLAGGRPATAYGVRLMAQRGLDLGQHRSRRLEPELVEVADLVIGMAREHVVEAVVLVPAASERAFTLKELVRRGEAAPRQPEERLATWLARLAADRHRGELLSIGHDPDYDVADPIGCSFDDYAATAAELDDLLRRLARLLASGEARARQAARPDGASARSPGRDGRGAQRHGGTGVRT